MSIIYDGWAEIAKYIADGSYSTRYTIGDMKTLDIEIDDKCTTIIMQIAAFDKDVLFDTGDKVPITWISESIISCQHMALTGLNKGGWMLSNMRQYCAILYEGILDAYAKMLIKPARKTSYHANTNSSHTTKDYCWIPSVREVYGEKYHDEMGPCYTSLFNNDNARVKYDFARTPAWWWLRSSGDTVETFCQISTNGTLANTYPFDSSGVVLGFCTAV